MQRLLSTAGACGLQDTLGSLTSKETVCDLAAASKPAPLCRECNSLIPAKELGDSMGIMMFEEKRGAELSATVMRVSFTFLFPSGMTPQGPLAIANSSAPSAASFVRLIFLL